LAQRFALQEHAQCIGVDCVLANQGGDHCTLVHFHLQQRLRFQLAQRLAHRHAADTVQVGNFLLAHGGARWQAAIENGAAQAFFNNATRQVCWQLFAGQHVSKFDFLGQAKCASTTKKLDPMTLVIGRGPVKPALAKKRAA